MLCQVFMLNWSQKRDQLVIWKMWVYTNLKKSQSLTEVDKNNTYDFISRKYSVKMSLKISNQYYTLLGIIQVNNWEDIIE